MERLKNILKEYLLEYWGEVSGGVVRDQGTKEAQRTGPSQPDEGDDPMWEDDDPFMLKKKGVMVPDDAKKKIAKYFKSMKMEPTDKPGKTYK